MFENVDATYKMMLMGRDGYEKYLCVHYRKKKPEWYLYHNQHQVNEIFMTAFTLWKNHDLASSSIERDNDHKHHQNEGKTENQIAKLVPRTSANEPTLQHFAPKLRNALPELHMLLGIWNKMQNNFWNFAHEKIKVMSEELIEVQNFNMSCCVTLKRSEESLEKHKEGLKLAAYARKEFNATKRKK